VGCINYVNASKLVWGITLLHGTNAVRAGFPHKSPRRQQTTWRKKIERLKNKIGNFKKILQKRTIK
ncbi:MAG: hypothetical protein K6B74_07145, partial [Ruminococcus sp.]|nr:hypothetical protein [Ruminococcus sp.]